MRKLALAIFCISGLIYFLLAGPTFFWLDSSEFVAAAWGLGVAHPPGHPLASLIGRLFCLLPLGTISFRVTLASVLEAASATGIITLICGQILDRLSFTHNLSRWVKMGAAAIAALCVGFSFSLGFQAVRAEVYALNVLLLTCIAYFLLRWDATQDIRNLLIAAFIFGLALCNHHFLVLLAAPPILLFIFLRNPVPRRWKQLIGIVAAGCLGLSTLIYLPLRAQQLPEVNWGAPYTAKRFFWVVSAQAFQKALDKGATEPFSQRTAGAFFALLEGLGPIAAFLALGGLYFLWREQQTRRMALLLTGLVGCNLLSPILIGFDPQNPDAHGYLAVAVVFLCPGVAIFIMAIAHAVNAHRSVAIKAWGPKLLCLAALGLPLYQAAIQLPKCNLRAHWAAEETTHQILDQPHGALIFTSYFETIFNLWAVQVTSDLRPDLSIIHRHFLSQPGYLDSLRVKISPTIWSILNQWNMTGQIGNHELHLLTEFGPLFFEYDFDLETNIIQHSNPAGLLLHYSDLTKDTKDTKADQHQQRIEIWMKGIGDLQENETRRALAWTHFLLAHFACQRHQLTLAKFHYHYLRSLAPMDMKSSNLAHQCGL